MAFYIYTKKELRQLRDEDAAFLCAHLNMAAMIFKGIPTVDDGELVHQVTILSLNETGKLGKKERQWCVHKHINLSVLTHCLGRNILLVWLGSFNQRQYIRLCEQSYHVSCKMVYFPITEIYQKSVKQSIFWEKELTYGPLFHAISKVKVTLTWLSGHSKIIILKQQTYMSMSGINQYYRTNGILVTTLTTCLPWSSHLSSQHHLLLGNTEKTQVYTLPVMQLATTTRFLSRKPAPTHAYKETCLVKLGRCWYFRHT